MIRPHGACGKNRDGHEQSRTRVAGQQRWQGIDQEGRRRREKERETRRVHSCQPIHKLGCTVSRVLFLVTNRSAGRMDRTLLVEKNKTNRRIRQKACILFTGGGPELASITGLSKKTRLGLSSAEHLWFTTQDVSLWVTKHWRSASVPTRRKC